MNMFKPSLKIKEFKEILIEEMGNERRSDSVALLESFQDILDCDKFIEDLERSLPRLKNIEDARGKRVLVIGECGYGDCIWLYRYVKVLCNTAKEVYYLVGAPLVPLFEEDKKNSKLQNLHITNSFPAPKCDHFLWSFDLPVVFDFKIYYAKSSYLNIGPIKVEENSVGVAFGNSDTDEGAKYRNVSMRSVSKFKREGITLYNFSNRRSVKCENLYKTFDNFLDTAKKLKEMKYFVCTDCVMLNLAGALGVPTYVLLNYTFQDEWMWYLSDSESIKWYSSVKPFVGEYFGDWKTPIKNVLKAIEIDLTSPK